MSNNVLIFLVAVFFLLVSAQVPPENVIPFNTTTTRTTTTTTPVPPSSRRNTIKPKPEEWISNTNPDMRDRLANWLLAGCWGKCESANGPYNEATSYEGYDGWYNNIAQPDLGAIDRPLLRRWPAAYEDGTYQPSGNKRPNPLELSEKLLKGDIGSQSKVGRNALLVFFGQQVVEEILDAQRPACPPEYFNIPIPANHSYLSKPGHTEMPVLRTRYDMKTGYSPQNPRQQLNEITPYLDGGLMYGTSKAWADQLRTYKNGTIDPDGLLAYSHGGLYPEYNTARLPMANPPPPAYHSQFIKHHTLLEVSRFFKLGNPRGNENPFLLTFGILWFRWHNYLARNLRELHPEWSGEKVFNEARKWVIATQQHIVVNVWLTQWLGVALEKYEGYNPAIDPQIDQFFQSAAFRFGHTLVPPGVYVRDYARNNCSFQTFGSIRTCNSFWRPQEFILANFSDTEHVDIDRILMGMAVQLSEREDHKIVEDLRGNVFGPLEFSRRDLMALNIQRARDHGLPDYNTARKAYGLPPVKNVSHFKHVDKEIRDQLLYLYNNSLNDIDIWIGGILETGDAPGELFQNIILDQFRRIRAGDRYWFENTKNRLFSDNDISRIKLLNFYDIIMAVTKMDADDIQKNPFRVPSGLGEINNNCRSKLVSSQCNGSHCYHLPQLNAQLLNQSCVEPGTYDYFRNSEASYVLSWSFILCFLVGTAGVAYLLLKLKERKQYLEKSRIADRVRQTYHYDGYTDTPYSAKEWTGVNNRSYNPVILILNEQKRQIQVMTLRKELQRALDVSHLQSFEVIGATDKMHLLIRTTHEYDLVVKFDSAYLRSHFVQMIEEFSKRTGIRCNQIKGIKLNQIFKQAITKVERQRRLEMFFRVVFSQAFSIQHSDDEVFKLDENLAKEVICTELTINEFAESLCLNPTSKFAKNMFQIVDKNKNGFISFREFLDIFIIFANGTAEQKVKLLFDMYDINHTKQLSREDFLNMLKSFMETVRAQVDQSDLDSIVNEMLREAQLSNKTKITFDDFKKLIKNDIEKLGKANIGLQGAAALPNARQSVIDTARGEIENIYSDPHDIKQRLQGISTQQDMPLIGAEDDIIVNTSQPLEKSLWQNSLRLVEQNSKKIFWVSLYTLVLLAIFAERAYYYSVEREHSGLRRIAGYGVTITRGAASAMMFTYSSLLVTMCRNTITVLRDTFLNEYIIFDEAVSMHKYIALWALAFTVLHIIGHAFNFYHISTQTADDLTCLFRNYFHATHELPKFHYWCWQTITGFTGVILTLITAIIFIFAIPVVREKLYKMFWVTHMMYPLFYIFIVLHGAGRLIQEPYFFYFFLGPVILFTIDSLFSASRKKIEIPVVRAELLASGVTMLEFVRPHNFQYKSGQWVRLACEGLNQNEYHPLTLSSSPHEQYLTVHIRAVGPWTTNIRSVYDPALLQDSSLPKVYLDGPYGEGHQDWGKYDVSILIGGGIGVTPFASILKDIVFKVNNNQNTLCKKVYFMWVSRTQHQFEWLVDIIRELETADTKHIVSSHIFITQFYHKFDLRTIMLYICERHYQKSQGKSLFTGLRAVTHFGRPNFAKFFKSIQSLHSEASSVGVFSCGPVPMTNTIENDRIRLNKLTSAGPIFEHHYKNF